MAEVVHELISKIAYKYPRNPVREVMLINQVTLTEHGSRERKLAVPPLGLTHLAAQLHRFDFEVNVLDSLMEPLAIRLGYHGEQAGQGFATRTSR